MRTLACLPLVLGLFLAGCGGDGPGPGEGSPRSEAEVASDQDATAAEIVAAGSPFDADGAEGGSRLVLYRVMGETGDVEQTAWRLYGAGGSPVAEGKGGNTVLGTGGGFWVGDVVVGADGTTVSLATAREPLATQPGDVVVSDFEEILALRPDPLTKFAPRPTPRGFGQGWTLDAQGRPWYQQVEPEKVLVGGGGSGWTIVRAVPVLQGQHLLGFGITAVGDHVVLPVVRSVKGEQVAIEALAVRRTDAPAGTAWKLLPAGPLASGTREASPRTFAADDWHYVFSDLRGAPYVLDLRSGQWSSVSLPTDGPGWTLEPGRDGLYALPPSGAEETEKTERDAWLSTDLGLTWKQLPH